MKISVVIPIYNEAETISEVFRRIMDVDIEKEIIAVDDFSRDGTRQILEKFSKVDGVKLFFHDQNLGKGSALRTGFKHATGDIVIIQDADLEYDPRDYIKLLKPFTDQGAEVVYGSRFLNRKNFPHSRQPFYLTHFIGNKLLNFLLNLLYGTKITDMETCYKVIKKEQLDSMRLSAHGFEIEPEITSQLIRKGLKIHEVPISYTPRDYKHGKKISWKDGFIAVYVLLKYRFKEME